MRRSSLYAALVVAFATLSGPALAQWKWRDSAGHVQYSDMPPPPGVPEKDILQQPSGARRAPAPAVAPPAAPATSSAMPARVDPELEARRKAAEQDQLAKQKAEQDRVAAVQAQNCSKARVQLKALQDGIRMARTNDKGEREVLDDAARLEEIRNTQAIISSDCK